MSKPSRKNRSKKTDQLHEESLSIKDGVDELEQEGDGDYVTKAYVYEMMKMQESLFRNLFDSLLTSVNSRIDRIPEEPDETWEDTESKAKVALESKLNLPFKVEIERAHRTGKVNRRSDDNASSTRPRTVICRLVSWKQKDPILKAARIVKPDGMFVNEDLAAETLQRRKDQLPKLKQAKQAGKIAYFALDKLIIKDRPSI